MKRSEMVQDIEDYLDLVQPKDGFTTNDMAEYIVHLFEMHTTVDYEWEDEDD